MKKLSLALLFALALVTPSFAKTFKVPDEGSFASITIPDDWKSKEIDKGVESQSADNEVYFAVEATDAKGNGQGHRGSSQVSAGAGGHRR